MLNCCYPDRSGLPYIQKYVWPLHTGWTGWTGWVHQVHIIMISLSPWNTKCWSDFNPKLLSCSACSPTCSSWARPSPSCWCTCGAGDIRSYAWTSSASSASRPRSSPGCSWAFRCCSETPSWSTSWVGNTHSTRNQPHLGTGAGVVVSNMSS